VKIRSIKANNRKRAFEISTSRGVFPYPYVKVDPMPTPDDPIVVISLDEETGHATATYRLASGAEGWVHVEQALDYNQEPKYMRDLLLHKLTLEAERRVKESPLSKREIIRRLRTSPAQFYRLLDPTNYRKSVDQMLQLLYVLDCDIEVVVKAS